MAKVNIDMIQGMGALANGFYRHDLRSAFPGPVYMGLGYGSAWRGMGAGCPEGSRMVNGECVCYDGRVWMPDGSRCVSPQSPAYTGAVTWEESKEGHTPDTYGQQELSDTARKVIEQSGLSINCKVDDSWFSGPQGGQPSRVCSISGSPYQFGAYAINLNPRGAITDYFQWKAVEDISKATGIPGGALRSTPETTALIQQVAQSGVVDQGAAAAAKKAYEDKRQLQADLVPGVDYDAVTGDLISWKAHMAFSNTADNRLIADAASTEPGSVLPEQQAQQTSSPYTGGYNEIPAGWTAPTINYYGAPTGATAGGNGAGGGGEAFDLSAIPSWAWLAAGVAGFFLMSK